MSKKSAVHIRCDRLDIIRRHTIQICENKQEIETETDWSRNFPSLASMAYTEQ